MFARQAFADGYFSNSEFQFYSDLRTRLSRRLPLRNVVLYLDVDPKECLHRVHNVRKRVKMIFIVFLFPVILILGKSKNIKSFEAGITLEYLVGLDKYYKEFCREMLDKTTVVTVDWNNYGKAENVIDLLKDL